MTSKRKPYNNRSGYIASRHNLINKEWAVIYLASDQGIDCGSKYAVVCEGHGSILGCTNLKLARLSMKYPDFCEECKKDINN